MNTTSYTSYGTSHFVSLQSAVRYYAAYEADPAKAVQRKLNEGSIHIGEPMLREGQRLSVNHTEGRYFITEGRA